MRVSAAWHSQRPRIRFPWSVCLRAVEISRCWFYLITGTLVFVLLSVVVTHIFAVVNEGFERLEGWVEIWEIKIIESEFELLSLDFPHFSCFLLLCLLLSRGGILSIYYDWFLTSSRMETWYFFAHGNWVGRSHGRRSRSSLFYILEFSEARRLSLLTCSSCF